MIAWLKTITPSQWRSIIVGLLGLIVSSSSELKVMGLPESLVPAVVAWSGFGITALGIIGTILNSQVNQTASVAASIEDPIVKAKMVQVVAGLKGISPLQLNEFADRTLIELGANPNLPKILPPTSEGKRP